MCHKLFLLLSLLFGINIHSGDEAKSESILDCKVVDMHLAIAKSQSVPRLSVAFFIHHSTHTGHVEVTNSQNTFRELGAASVKDVTVTISHGLNEYSALNY